MKLLFVHSHVFKYDNYKNFYSGGQFPYKVLQERYLAYSDKLVVAARGKKVNSTENLNLSSGPNVEHYILPNLSVLKDRSDRVKKLNQDLEKLIHESDALVARMPSIHAYHAIKIARQLNKPYVVEVVGDVFLSLWTHGHIFGKILAPVSYIKYRNVIKQSPYLIYVTEEYLQNKYPYHPNAVTINASNVDLPYVSERVLQNKITRIRDMDIENEIKIGLIGSYASKYKGIDTAIKSIKILNDRGYNCRLYVLGSGNNEWLINLSKKIVVEDKVVFAGSLPGGEQVLEWLDTMDIYIQPSLTEGLPRSLIEAMSRALPSIGSSVGGIPELIDQSFIHTPESEKMLSDKIEHLLMNKEIMLEQSKKNFVKSKEYTSDVLNNRRKKFWSHFINKEL